MSQSNKDKLLKVAKSTDFKLAIAAQPEMIKGAVNPFFYALSQSFGRVEEAVNSLVEDGLSFQSGDFYVYYGKGGIKVHETPKGIRKQLQRIALQHNLSIIVLDGVFYENDRISVKSNGQIEEIEIIKDQQTLIKGGLIIAPYAVVTVFKNDKVIARKMTIIPKNEYDRVPKGNVGKTYPTMMAQKTVMKRVVNSIYSLLGVSLSTEDKELLDDIDERLIDDERDSEPEEVQEPPVFEEQEEEQAPQDNKEQEPPTLDMDDV